MEIYKILMVHNYYQIAGGEDTVVQSEMDMLRKKGHEVYIYERHNEEIKNKGILGKIKLFFETIFSIKTYRQVRKIIKENHIDIVHVHNTLPLISPSVYYAAFSKKVPVIQTIHNFRLMCPSGIFCRDDKVCEECLYTGLKSALKHKCYRKSFTQTLTVVAMLKVHRLLGTYNKIDGYITLTEFNKNKLSNLIKDEKKIFVKPNFVKGTLDNSTREIENYFAYVGRLDKVKGIKILLDAWRNIENSKLYIIGDGPERYYVEKFIKNNNLENIEYLGFKKRAEVLEVMKKSKALIVPSQWYEGLPMTIIEGFSLGVPVICGDIGNSKSVVEDKVSGLHFIYNNVLDLASKCELLIEDSILNKKLGSGAFKAYETKYCEEKNYKFLIDIYNRVDVKLSGKM